MNEQRRKGNIDELKRRLMAEFGFAGPTVERIFTETLGRANPDRCINCNGNMLEQIFTFDCADALLLLAMGRAVRHEATKKAFTLANVVHVPTLDVTHAVKCRTTQCAKLGLIAKYKVKNKHGKDVQIPGMWVVTARGWEALRGQPVPKRVVVWHGEIQERPGVVTTLADALQTNHKRLMKAVAAREGKIQVGIDYNPAEWAEYGRAHQGAIL